MTTLTDMKEAAKAMSTAVDGMPYGLYSRITAAAKSLADLVADSAEDFESAGVALYHAGMGAGLPAAEIDTDDNMSVVLMTYGSVYLYAANILFTS